MSDVEIVMIGLGLSMDAFAAALCRGLAVKKLRMNQILLTGLCFGGFQGLMPLAGYLLGRQFEGSIGVVDHWVAFTLLTFIGSKMIWDAAGESENSCEDPRTPEQTGGLRGIRPLLSLAVATSIDALAAGIPFAFLQVDIVRAASMIGMITFFLSSAGVVLGCRFGSSHKKTAALAGGLILIIMGIDILAEHMGMPF